ncbi:hypothetical protein B0H65DRAFT_548905 [Neurospora tetraspora]|uniref:Uncharacterized protein n=1 Tax=Neurospora tetraspora TaxID=94610 RepID=A0AAE0MT13_9PEZI|nr:hypothetical protein B0H65DRAFT_548905 [Neurospora tetraspora]
MCTKHFIDSYCTSCDELVQGRSTESPCKPKYRGEHLGHCAGGIETKTVTEAVVCKNCERKQRRMEKKKKDKDKGKGKEKKQKCGCGSAAVELASVNEEEQPLTES